jgi:hypothetical protein
MYLIALSSPSFVKWPVCHRDILAALNTSQTPEETTVYAQARTPIFWLHKQDACLHFQISLWASLLCKSPWSYIKPNKEFS